MGPSRPPAPAPTSPPETVLPDTVFPAAVSLVVGLGLFAAKLAAWHLTGSAAVLSDALESVVNVLAAGFALFSVRLAARPPDRGHPYGHGKIEQLSGAFEGGLVLFAAVAIVLSAVRGLVLGVELQALDLGLALTAAAGVVNLALGSWLLRRGRALGSPALVADGQHVLSDVWTTVGVLVGLGLVRLTGLTWLDPLAALVVGLVLARTGLRILRESGDALMDATDPELLRTVHEAWRSARVPGIIDLHKVRAIQGGAEVHIDAHAHVPEFWRVDQAHAASRAFEAALLEALGTEGELALHLDPCERAWCHCCDLADCPVRAAPFEAYRELTPDALPDDAPPPRRAPGSR